MKITKKKIQQARRNSELVRKVKEKKRKSVSVSGVAKKH
jgi:hypothetical protein